MADVRTPAPQVPRTSRARLRRRAGTAFLALGLLLLATTWTAVLAFSEEVRILARRHGPAEVEEARALRDLRDDPAEVYGVPEGRPVRVLFAGGRDRIEPPEAPGLVLLFVDRAHGSSPLLARTVAAAGTVGALCLLLGGLALRAGAAPARAA